MTTTQAEDTISVDALDVITDAPGLNWQEGEKYDPFKGTIKHVITDFRIPGDGPDLLVVRNINRILVPTLSNLHADACVRWNDLENDGDNRQTFSVSQLTQFQPVFELYNKTISLYHQNVVNSSEDYGYKIFVSADNWALSCENQLPVVYSPNGMRYYFGERRDRLRLTSIRDTTGNTISYNYRYMYIDNNGDADVLSSISASDGRRVSFGYQASTYRYSTDRLSGKYFPSSYGDNSSPNRRFRSIVGKAVTREDGRKWQYVLSGDRLSEVTYPNGLKINYTYVERPKMDYIGNVVAGDPAFTNRKDKVLSRRVLSNKWNDSEDWNFAVSVNNSDNTLTREIVTPSGSMSFQYRRLYTRDSHKVRFSSTYEALYDNERRDRGKLLQYTRYATDDANLSQFRSRTKSSSSADKIVKSYVWQRGAEFLNWRKVRDFKNRGAFYKANRVRMSSVTTKTIENGISSSSKRAFTAYDKYNHPVYIKEYQNGYVNDSSSYRLVTQTYDHRTSPHLLLGKLKSRRISGVGTTSHEYNDLGQRTATTENKIRTRFSYHTKGQLNRVTYADNTYEQYSNYYYGTARTERNRNGHARYLTVNSNGTVATVSRWNDSGAKWRYNYDTLRRVSQVTSPQSGRSAITYSWSTHDGGENLTEKQGIYTKVTKFNTLGLPISEQITGFGGTLYSSWSRDVLGRVINQQVNRLNLDNGVKSRFTYDGFDRVLHEYHTAHNNAEEHIAHNYGVSTLNGRAHPFVKITDARGNDTTTWLESYGSPSNAWPVRIDRAGAVTTIGRDKIGRTTSLAQGGKTRTYVYRGEGSAFEGLLNYETHPETDTSSYSYNTVGRVSGIKTGGQWTNYTYFNDGSLRRINRADDSSDIDYTYYPQGTLKTIAVGNGVSRSYNYDKEDGLLSESINVNGKSFSLAYGINNLGYRKEITYPTGRRYSLLPNVLGQKTRIIELNSDNNGWKKVVAQDLKYYANGLIDSAKLGSKITFDQHLKANHLPHYRKTLVNGVQTLRHGYEYDLNRNVTAVTIRGETYDNISMVYDKQNRLTQAKSNNQFGTRDFTYDGADNMLTQSINGWKSTYIYDSSNRLSSISGGPAARSGLYYDGRGNLRNNGKVTINYNAANQVTSTSDGNSYLYDGHGRRVRTTKNGEHTYNVYGQDGVLRYRLDDDKDAHSEYHYVAGKMVARRDSSLSDGGGGSGGGTGGSGGGTGSSGEGAFEQTGNGVVSMEAESASLEAGSSSDRWEVQTLSGASSSEAAVAIGSGYHGGTDAGTYAKSPRLHWQVTADRSGNHDVWVRTYTKNGSTDSVHLSVDNTFKGTYWHGSADYNQWVWKKLSVSLSSGQTHTVTLWAREMGIAIDKVVIVPTGTNVPSGSGPTETDRDGEDGSGGGTGGGTGGSGGGSGGGTGSSGEGAFIQGSDKTVSLEAENAERTALNGDWADLDGSSYSNDQAVKANVTSRRDYANGPSLKWTIKAAHSGEYNVWALIRNTGGNSVYTNLDGDNGYQYFSSSSSWGWREFWNRKVNLTAGGEHTFEIWVRDPGVEIDKVVLLPSSNSAPTGEGPAESTRDGEGEGEGEGSGGGTGGSGGGTGGSGGSSGGSDGEGAYLQGSDKRFTMEAENAERALVVTGKWADLLGAGMSGDAAVKLDISTWGYGSAAQGPSLTWTLKATHGGNYRVWLRTRSSNGDSVFTDMDGATKDQHFSTSASWTWFKLNHATVALTAGGEHTFKIWAREAGLEIDKVMLVPATDSYTPSGEGPAESTRDGEDPGVESGGSGGESGGSSGSGIYLQAANKTVSLEAESGAATSLNGSWQIFAGAGLSIEQAMRANVVSRRDYGMGPSLKWTIKASHGGEYKVWALIRNTGGNSVYTNLDGDNGYQYFASSTSWGWREFWNRKVNLTAGGEHTFEIWARDPGVEIDKVVLLPTSSAAPTGEGPATSAQQ